MPLSQPVKQTQDRLHDQRSSSSVVSSSHSNDHNGKASPAAAVKTESSASEPEGGSVAPSPEALYKEDVMLVQRLIEKCMHFYLTEDEIVNVLCNQASIEPSFTSFVLQQLQISNPEFFRAYSIRLRIKEHIIAYNYLIKLQSQLLVKAQAKQAPKSDTNSLNRTSSQANVPQATTSGVNTARFIPAQFQLPNSSLRPNSMYVPAVPVVQPSSSQSPSSNLVFKNTVSPASFCYPVTAEFTYIPTVYPSVNSSSSRYAASSTEAEFSSMMMESDPKS